MVSWLADGGHGTWIGRILSICLLRIRGHLLLGIPIPIWDLPLQAVPTDMIKPGDQKPPFIISVDVYVSELRAIPRNLAIAPIGR